MKFFDRWKKRSFEEKMDDLSQTVLTENNIKDPKQVEQYLSLIHISEPTRPY